MADKGLLQFTSGSTQSDADIITENRKRYVVIETGARNARQIKCFDNSTQKEVWGTFKSVSANSKEQIFVPNLV